MTNSLKIPVLVAGFWLAATGLVLGHGDVLPQPVDTAALPDVGEEWLEENPYRSVDPVVWKNAVEIGASGYNQNCARCHGLEVISGGLAPDLRYLEANIDGDEWYVERFQYGYTQGGTTKMPAFGELLGQKAAWAIRTYIETRPDDGALDDYADRLKDIRDSLTDMNDKITKSEISYDDVAAEVAAIKAEMSEIAGNIATASEAPVADSPASRAVAALDGSPDSLARATETLTVGLSAAQ